MRIFGLIGKDLIHSGSASYFTKKFLQEHIRDAVYRNFPIPDVSGIRGLVSSDARICGLNVTIPYKKEIMPWLDQIDRDARSCGAVNVICIDRSGGDINLNGLNTDYLAFRETLIPVLRPWHKKALILGTGGAAGAAGYALQTLGVAFQYVSRQPGEGQISYGAVNRELLAEHHIVINATPLGMYPETERCPPVDYRGIGAQHLLYDMVYNPETTLFLSRGREAGATVINGMGMLRMQAELSWEAWNMPGCAAGEG